MEAEYGGSDDLDMVRVGTVGVAKMIANAESWLLRYVNKKPVGDGHFRMEFECISSASFCQRCLNAIEEALGYNLTPYTSRGAELDHCDKCYECHPLLLLQLPDDHPANNAVRSKKG